jgi:hypothetical protein
MPLTLGREKGLPTSHESHACVRPAYYYASGADSEIELRPFLRSLPGLLSALRASVARSGLNDT